MLNYILLYMGALMMAFWGVAHIFPTRNVVKGFGDISDDNKYIITMEWVVEGLSFIFIAALVASMTLFNGSSRKKSRISPKKLPKSGMIYSFFRLILNFFLVATFTSLHPMAFGRVIFSASSS